MGQEEKTPNSGADRSCLTLCVSHQSTLGRPVTPAAFITWVGFTCSAGAEGAGVRAQCRIK